MILAFKLSMPGNNSWNGRWSGDERLYVVTKSFTGRKGVLKAEEILKHGRYHHSFGDGWVAGIDVEHVSPSQAASLRRRSNGFCGYEWMVNTIIEYGEPMNSLQVARRLAEREAAQR